MLAMKAWRIMKLSLWKKVILIQEHLQIIIELFVNDDLGYVWFSNSTKKEKNTLKNDFIIYGFTMKNAKKKKNWKSSIITIIKKFIYF